MRIWNHVDSKIIFSLMVLFVISTGSVFAQQSLITVQTDDDHYDEGDTVVISGTVDTIIGETPATLQLLFEEENLVDIAQITIAQDGSYSHTIIAEGPQWQKQGEYLIRASYGDGNIAEATFMYTPESEIAATTKNFEVDAGNHGTFDVEYTIQGGTVKNMVVDSEIFALIVQIESIDEGSITAELPREFIGAEKQDGKDDTFIVLIDGIEVGYEEAVVLADNRVITINFEQGDSDIEIIGTYVVPEFGTIVMMILIIGIMATIIITRNKFQITI